LRFQRRPDKTRGGRGGIRAFPYAIRCRRARRFWRFLCVGSPGENRRVRHPSSA